MPPHHAQANPLIGYAITAVVVAVVLALRWRRISRVVPLKLERLWIVPALYAGVAAVTFSASPPVGLTWLYCLFALALGAALGWQRGKLMRITVDPQTHALNQTSSPANMIFLLALVVVRSGARAVLAREGDALHLNALVVTDLLIALALGLLVAQRLEMYLRAKRLLASFGRP